MDETFVERARGGDERAFEALTITWHPRLFRLAHGILRDPVLAEDAAQRAFLETWRRLPRLKELERFEGWVTGHLVRACRSLDAGRRAVDDSDGTVAGDVFGLDPLGSFVDRDQLSRGFRQLDFDDRAVLVLRYLGQLDDDAAGLALALKAESLEARVEAALQNLGRWLDGEAATAPGLKPQIEGV